jgi:Sec-independent protein translocase protein TatA
MKIKRFNENEVQGPEGTMNLVDDEVQGPGGTINLVNDISTDKAEKIIKEMGGFLSSFQDILSKLKKFEQELAKYKSKSKKSNDQIDDSVVQLQKVNKSLEQDVQNKLDSIIKKLNNYITNGRNFIYEE